MLQYILQFSCAPGQKYCQLAKKDYAMASGITTNVVIPGPETEVIAESGSRGLGAQPPDAEKGLILHVLRIA